jgi:hypothetical protein
MRSHTKSHDKSEQNPNPNTTTLDSRSQTVTNSDLGSQFPLFLANNDDPKDNDRGGLNKGDDSHPNEKMSYMVLD